MHDQSAPPHYMDRIIAIGHAWSDHWSATGKEDRARTEAALREAALREALGRLADYHHGRGQLYEEQEIRTLLRNEQL